ncbi:MAG: thiamine pyrophosphate-dependent dehydrogenase E1 component subunit alpha [Candidatus Binatia bacterium]
MHEGLFRSLYRIRRVEEEIARIYPSDKIKSPVHLSIGQEAVSVGVCEALRPDDVVFGTYRSHAYYLAKGGDVKKMFAELYGKATGCAKGKGGSMHLVDAAHGVMGASAVVGTTIPNAVGYAYALRLQGSDSIVVSFFGDGATDEGVFYESLNFAALKRLPIIFVCENNFYAIHTHLLRRHKDAGLCGRVSAYGVLAEQIGDNDVLKIHERAKSAVGSLRKKESGPFFLECLTYRWKEHVGPGEDFHLGYRSREEARPWMEGDQLLRLSALIPAPNRERIAAEVEAEIREAIAGAEQDPFPDARELLTDVTGD